MKHRDEDGRTLLHTAAAAGERASTREATRAAYGDTERHVFFERGVFVVYAILTPPPARRPLVNLRAGKVQLCDFFLRTPGGQLLVDKGDEEDWVPLHSAASCGQDRCVFNAGVFILRPELEVACALLRQRAGQYCEHQITDQSLLNRYFVGRWKSMPARYNVGARLSAPHDHVANESLQLSGAAIWHMWGEPKPWDVSWVNGAAATAAVTTQSIGNASKPSVAPVPRARGGETRVRGHGIRASQMRPLVRRWHEACGGITRSAASSA